MDVEVTNVRDYPICWQGTRLRGFCRERTAKFARKWDRLLLGMVSPGRHIWIGQGLYSPSLCCELKLSISPLRLGVEVDMHACLIAFTQIEYTTDHIDAGTGFASFNLLISHLEPCKRYEA